MATWLTSDTHYGHENIIAYCNRPYSSAAEMNFDMIRRWNDIVAPEDLVYHLGDFAMGDPAGWPKYRAALHGRIILVRGNHDKKMDAVLKKMRFEDVVENVVVEIDGVRCWLNHYPLTEDDEDRDHRGRRNLVRPEPPDDYDLALCGHIHQKWTVKDDCVNVGVDRWNSTPISVGDAQGALESL